MYKQRNETIHYEYNFGKYFVTWIVYQITSVQFDGGARLLDGDWLPIILVQLSV